jgi:hypothetical protein
MAGLVGGPLNRSFALSGCAGEVCRARLVVQTGQSVRPYTPKTGIICSRAPLNRRRVAQRVSKARIKATVSRVRILFPPPRRQYLEALRFFTPRQRNSAALSGALRERASGARAERRLRGQSPALWGGTSRWLGCVVRRSPSSVAGAQSECGEPRNGFWSAGRARVTPHRVASAVRSSPGASACRP